MAGAVEVGTGFVALVPSAKGIAGSITRELGGPVERAAISSGARASGAMEKSFAGRAKSMAKSVTKALMAGVVVVGLLAVGAFKLGSDFKSAYNTIRVETGATGKVLQGLQGDFRAVLSQRPEGMAAVALTVSKLNQGLGLTGPSLQEVSKSVLRLSSITKTDLGTNLTSVTKLFNNWGVAAKDQPGRLDQLFRASQKTGVSVADLAQVMAKAGSPLRQLGFSFTDSAAMLGLLSKAGVDAGAVMPALSKSIAKATKEGKPAGAVFRDVFNRIRGAKSDTAAAGAAIDVFGARAGPNLAGLIRQGKLSFDDLSKSILSGGDTIAKAASDTAGFSGKWKIFLNQMRVAVEPIAVGIVTFAISAMTALAPYLTRFAGAMRVVADRISAFFAARPGARFAALAGVLGLVLAPVIIGLVTTIGGLLSPVVFVVAGIAALAAGVLYAYRNFAGFRKTVDGVAHSVADFVRNTISKAQLGISALVAAFNGDGITSNGFVGFMERVGVAARVTSTWISTKLVPALQHFGEKLRPVIVAVGDFVKRNPQKVFAAIGAVLLGLVSPVALIATVFGVLFTKNKAFHDFVMGKLLPGLKSLGQWLGGQFATFAKAFSDRWADIKAAVSHVFTALKVIVFVVLAVIIVAWRTFHDQIMAVLLAGWNFIKSTVQNGFAFVKGIFDIVLGLLSGDWGRAWDGLKGALSAIWRQILTVITLAWSTLRAAFFAGLHALGALWSLAWNGLKQLPGIIWAAILGDIKTGWGQVNDFLNAIPATVLGILSAIPSGIAGLFSGLADAMSRPFELAFNGIASIWNNTVGKLSFSIPDWVPGIGGKGFDVPDIPTFSLPGRGNAHTSGSFGNNVRKLAGGGVITRPTLALLGETARARPEIAAPAHMLRSIVDDAIAGNGRGGPLVHNENHFHGDDVPPEVRLDAQNRRLGLQLAMLGRTA